MAGSSTLSTASPNVRVTARIVNVGRAFALVDADAGLACDLDAGERALVTAINGSQSIGELARIGLALTPPLRPAATLGLLRRLQECGLLEGLSMVATVELGCAPRTSGAIFGRWLRTWATLRLPRPLASAAATVLAPVSLSANAARRLAAVMVALTTLALCVLVALGLDHRALDPFAGSDLAPRALELYIGAAIILSFRGLMRAMALRGAGATAALVVSLHGGVLHIDADDHACRWLDRNLRCGVYFAGIAGFALPAALFLLDRIVAAFVPHALPSLLTAALATAPYLLALDLAPYGRGDGWNLAGAWTLVPDLRRRAAAFLLRRSVRNLATARAPSSAERTYLLLATAWPGHALLAGWLLTEHLLPAVLHAVEGHARGGTEDMVAWSLGMTMAAGLLVVVALLAVALVAVLAAAVVQLAARKTSPSVASTPIGEADDDVLDAMAAVPFLAKLPRDQLGPIVAGMRRESHADGAVIVQQGEPGDRFCLLLKGTAEVWIEETSGLRHRVAALRPGDFFGEIALLEERPRTATVRARGDATVLTLDRPSFVALVEHSNVARDAVLEQVRSAAFLRSVDVFAHLAPRALGMLLGKAKQRAVAMGEAVIRQGEDGDSLYVIVDGALRVERSEGGIAHTLDTLGRGDVFGEFALLSGVARTATVIATTNAALIEFPGDCLDEILLHELRSAVTLDAAMSRRRLAHGAE